MKIAITAKARNGILWELVERCGSQANLARLLEVPPMTINGWLNFREIPKHLDTPRLVAIEDRLAKHFGVFLEDIFPQELRDKRELAKESLRKTKVIIQEVPVSQLLPIDAQKLLTDGGLAEINAEVDLDLLKQRLNQSLHTLTPRQEKAIKYRFGLPPYDREHTLAELGVLLGVTGERARAIEIEAIKQMRHFKRADPLKPFVG